MGQCEDSGAGAGAESIGGAGLLTGAWDSASDIGGWGGWGDL